MDIPLTAEERARINETLRKPLGLEYIETRSNGDAGPVIYIPGYVVPVILSEIFGFDGWTFDIIERTISVCISTGMVQKNVYTIIRYLMFFFIIYRKRRTVQGRFQLLFAYKDRLERVVMYSAQMLDMVVSRKQGHQGEPPNKQIKKL